MEELLGELARQAPALGVLVWLVNKFLSHLRAVSVAHTESMAKFEKTLEHLAQQMETAQRVNARLAQVVLYHDATVKGENPETMGSPAELIDKILKGS